MPIFQYQAYGLQGEFFEGRIDAVSHDTAREMLWSKGQTPFALRVVDQAAAKWWQRELFSRSGFKHTDLVSFTREFVTLSAAEIPLDDALRILCDQATSPGVRAMVADLLADVLNGSTLSDAMQRQSHIFPTDYISVVRAGEIGGKVSEVFAELADLLERRMEIRGRIRSALVYPSILIVLSMVSLTIIIGGLIPSIAPMLAESGKPMPGAIQFLLMVQSHWLELASALTFIAAAATIAGTLALRRETVRVALDWYKLKLPLLGSFILQQETARFARTLGTMLRADVPLLQATTSARTVIGNRHIAAAMERAIELIAQGVALHRALRDQTMLPAIALRMISVGEEAGKLDRILMRLALMFEQQTQRSIDRFMAMFTPMLTVMIALVVGGLILPVMNAVLSINDVAMR
jgi:general secretion pathway protein F